jgi:hypothetical protein
MALRGPTDEASVTVRFVGADGAGAAAAGALAQPATTMARTATRVAHRTAAIRMVTLIPGECHR